MTEPRRSIAPVIIGLTITGLLLVFLAYATKRRTAELKDVPQLTLLFPAANDVLNNPVIVRFTSSQPIKLAATGWGYKRLHLHAWIDNTQYMPAATDIREISTGTYEWTLNGVQPGNDKILYLAWADASHHPIPEGASPRLTISVR